MKQNNINQSGQGQVTHSVQEGAFYYTNNLYNKDDIKHLKDLVTENDPNKQDLFDHSDVIKDALIYVFTHSHKPFDDEQSAENMNYLINEIWNKLIQLVSERNCINPADFLDDLDQLNDFLDYLDNLDE